MGGGRRGGGGHNGGLYGGRVRICMLKAGGSYFCILPQLRGSARVKGRGESSWNGRRTHRRVEGRMWSTFYYSQP